MAPFVFKNINKNKYLTNSWSGVLHFRHGHMTQPGTWDNFRQSANPLRHVSMRTRSALKRWQVFLRRLLAGLAVAAIPSVAAAAGDADHRQTLMHDGLVRSYLLRVPPATGSGPQKMPLVIVLHGGGGNAANAESMSGFTALAAREGFIVVYPEGSGRMRDRLLTWNAGHCCGYAMQSRIDDVGFIGMLLDRLIRDYPVDPQRIYVTGISNGGMMAHRLGSELAQRIAAIAPVVAAVFGDEKLPVSPVSALMINGMQDRSVPYQGGPPGGRFSDAWDGTPVKPAMAQAEFWRRANRCGEQPFRDERGAVQHWRYHCPAGQAVELYLLTDTGHTWPGGRSGRRGADNPGSTLDATAVIWAFFRTHRRTAIPAP